ncbi:MAG: hypothetical protein U5K55_02835 [Aliarcobacter sp.]|nr:hypothetical protein [Aliarcobacter sp.]
MGSETLEEITSFCKTLNLLYVVKDKNIKYNNFDYFKDFNKNLALY